MTTGLFYGTPNPLNPAGAAPVAVPRAPATTDLGYTIGQFWIFQPSGQLYYLASITAGSANWIPVGTGPGSVNTINLVGPVSGNINLIDQAGAGAIQITAPGSGGAGTVGIGVKVDGVTIQIIGDQLVAVAAVPPLTLQGNAPSLPQLYNANNFVISGIANGAFDVQTPAAGVANCQVKYDNVTIGVNGSNQLAVKNQLQFSLNTIGAVSDFTPDIAIPANQATTVYVVFTLIDSTLSFAASDIAQGVARDNAGVVTVVSGDFIDVSTMEDPALNAIDFILNPGGGASTVQIQVTGVAGQTLRWHVAVTLISTP